MNSIIQQRYESITGFVPLKASESQREQTRAESFFDIAAAVNRNADGVYGASEAEPAQKTAAARAEEYKRYLERRFGPVTIQSIGKDQASLEAAGKRMSGNDVVIAPNIFEEMVADPQKAAYYERKISYFFTDVIPNGRAFAASAGLTFEPCGVVIHEDGTVTYICGGGDSPERVAEVNAINRARDAKRAAQRKQYLERSTALAEQRRAMWAQQAEIKIKKSALPDAAYPFAAQTSFADFDALAQNGADVFFICSKSRFSQLL